MNPRRSNSSLPKPGRSAYGVATAVVLLLIPVIVLNGGNWLQDFLNFGAGVLSLVCLSCSVIWGLVAQDRIILNIRQRIVAQGVHRITAVASIAFLIVHIAIKLAIDHTVLIAALIPFSLGFTGSGGLIGLGSLAGLLMIFVGVTGALRNQFASPAPVAARWRAMHMLAYPAWCAALIHGLYAGRPVRSPLFTYLYELSLIAVMAMLALRAAPRPFKRKVADRIMSLLGGDERTVLDDLDDSRSRAAESAMPSGGGSLPGYEGRGGRRSPLGDTGTGAQPRVMSPSAPSSAPSYESPAAPQSANGFAAPQPANGFAAAYRTVTPPAQPRQDYSADQTAVMDPLTDMQGTGAMPRVNAGGTGSWPVPSPPPVGEAPPSAYDPLQDTGFNIPAYGSQGPGGYRGSDVYDTGETNTLYGTYNTNDTYNSGPTNAPTPGESFDAPGSGEPWNTPSGGYR
ncbi:cytochrome b/b6 domain-containing protein [Streptomyces sp. YIM S03343]